MTREEQIIEAGTYHLCGSRPPKTHGHNMHELAYISRNLVFEAGAKWADENPKPGIVNKHEFIEKTISYFSPILKTYCSEECVKELIDGFVNSMEG